MGKCDFCEKEAIGYVAMQAAIYCADHQEKAEEIEERMWAAHGRFYEIDDANPVVPTPDGEAKLGEG